MHFVSGYKDLISALRIYTKYNRQHKTFEEIQQVTTINSHTEKKKDSSLIKF